MAFQDCGDPGAPMGSRNPSCFFADCKLITEKTKLRQRDAE